jgi:hypothetical protein
VHDARTSTASISRGEPHRSPLTLECQAGLSHQHPRLVTALGPATCVPFDGLHAAPLSRCATNGSGLWSCSSPGSNRHPMLPPRSRRSAPSSAFLPSVLPSHPAKASTAASWQGSRPRSLKDTSQRRRSPTIQAPRTRVTTTAAQRSHLSAPWRPVYTPSVVPVALSGPDGPKRFPLYA